jgi:hypothetical protein
MSNINADGTLNTSKVIREIRKVIKSVDDTLFYCFDSIDGERRLMTREAINSLRILADEIERSEDDFYNLTNKKATDSLNLSEET